MAKTKLALISALVSSMCVGNAAFAANPYIMVSRDIDCAIYLCLPQGFPTAECQAPLDVFIKRVTSYTPSGAKIWTDLPDMSFCVESMPDVSTGGSSGGNSSGSGSDTESNVSYRSAYEVYMPQINKCTRWATRNITASQTENYCAAVSTTPARVFESQQPNHPYETINVGDTSYTKGMAPVKHYTEVLVDGSVTGNRYYK